MSAMLGLLLLMSCEFDRACDPSSEIFEFQSIISDHFPNELTLTTLTDVQYIHGVNSEDHGVMAGTSKDQGRHFSMKPPPQGPYLTYQDLIQYCELGCLTLEEAEFLHRKLIHDADQCVAHFSPDASFAQISSKELNEHIQERGDIFIPYRQCSVPLFSPDRRRVLFFVEHMGNAGSGWVYIFQKTSDHWQEIYSRNIWIS
ncbi:MAG: hypothetical protein H6568_04665 [Lewinellaceae bacterium]|nr:hypothetical protein [Lewinellaceae bacterium]